MTESKRSAERVGPLNSWRAFGLFVALYAACLAWFVSRLSLWLDEIVDLIGIRDYGFARLIAWVPVNAGGVPLGYLTRFASIHAFGYSTFSARVPSLIFSMGAGLGVFVLGRRLKLGSPLLAVAIFWLIPLQLRYALESRPYSLALALSVWATVVFLDLLNKTTAKRAFAYGVITLLGLYSMPYMVFVPIAHVSWVCFTRERPNRFRLLLLSALPIALAALAFLPWYLWTARLWSESVAGQHLRYTLEPKAALLVARELVGAGYLGTALVVAFAYFGLKSALPDSGARLFWLLYALLPIVLAVLADAMFGYFLAIRQMIYVLAPLSLLAALGIERLGELRRSVAAGSCCFLIATFLVADVRFFLRPREDWAAASRILRSLTERGTCIAFVPKNSAELYRFFIPELPKAACVGDFGKLRSVAIAVSPYGSGERSSTEAMLSANGLRRTNEFNPQGPKIELYAGR